jgi:hypothetical protein
MLLFQRFLRLLAGLLLCGSMSVSASMAAAAGPDNPAKAAAAPVAPVVPEPSFMGLDAGQVLTLLGAPSFKRSENGAKVWQYVEKGCVLNLFLFIKQPKPGLRVQYQDAAPLSQNPGDPVSSADRRRCLRVFTGHGVPPPSQ